MPGLESKAGQVATCVSWLCLVLSPPISCIDSAGASALLASYGGLLGSIAMVVSMVDAAWYCMVI